MCQVLNLTTSVHSCIISPERGSSSFRPRKGPSGRNQWLSSSVRADSGGEAPPPRRGPAPGTASAVPVTTRYCQRSPASSERRIPSRNPAFVVVPCVQEAANLGRRRGTRPARGGDTRGFDSLPPPTAALPALPAPPSASRACGCRVLPCSTPPRASPRLPWKPIAPPSRPRRSLWRASAPVPPPVP
jgi:hypothetical protein